METKPEVGLNDGIVLISSHEMKPHGRVGYYFTSDGKVRFRIGCERCGSNIETESMKLVA